VTGRYGTIGQVFLIKEDFWPLNTTLWVKDFHGNDQLFSSYLLRTIDFMSCSDKSSVPGVNRNDLHRIPVLLPPIAEQRAIAGVLGALDDKVEQNRQTARALERLARALFRAWFVDFEPVKAKAAGATAFPSMPQPTFDALPTLLVDSAIGPVPEGWEAGAIHRLATLSKTQVRPHERPEEVVDHFSIPAFDATMRPVVETCSAIKSSKFRVIAGSVLLSKLNPRIPRVWLPPFPRGRTQIASTEFLVFVPARNLDRHYLYCQFQESVFREDLAQGASGTSNSHQRVRPEDVLNRPVIVPPAPTREAFARITDPLFALVTANHDEAAMLVEMRDYLLPKLLSGDVPVRSFLTERRPSSE
jgi:type I restriction enzyme, S subunit